MAFDTPDPTPPALAALAHPDKDVRQQAAVALGERAEPKLAPSTAALLWQERDFFVRETLTWVLTRTPGPAVEAATTALQDDDPSVRLQSLHLLSAISFLCAYVLLFTDPVLASLVGWLVAMTSRQMGHFFFEPKGYDEVNQATHEHKEAIKVGYNLRRKVVLLAIWAGAPLLPLLDPTLLQQYVDGDGPIGFARQVGLLWLFIGVGGLLFRTIQLCLIRDATTAVTWMIKILTDPFHDIKLYHRAPLHLLRGQRIDPMQHRERF